MLQKRNRAHILSKLRQVSHCANTQQRVDFVLRQKTSYENLPMQYTEIFSAVKIKKNHQTNVVIFKCFAQIIDCGYSLELEPTEAVLPSAHNLYFGSKIRKTCIPLQTPVFYIKVGFKGIYISRTCFPDERQTRFGNP